MGVSVGFGVWATLLLAALALIWLEGQNRVLADYWIAYRLSFESRERIIAMSTGFVRYQLHDQREPGTRSR